MQGFSLCTHTYTPSLSHSLSLSLSSEYATDVNVMVARKAIQAIGRIALRLSTRANTCVDKLLALLIMEIDYITAETLVAMTSEYPPRDIRGLI